MVYMMHRNPKLLCKKAKTILRGAELEKKRGGEIRPAAFESLPPVVCEAQ